MAFTTTPENDAVNAIKGNATYISLHTADPSTSGTSEVTGGSYARVATVWGSASGGSATGSAATINVPSGTTITHWGLWTASTGGTFYYGGALAASEAFGSAGTYALMPSIQATN